MSRTHPILSRRQVLRQGSRTLLATGLLAPMLSRRRFRLFAGSREEYSTRTVDLVTSSLVVDMLSPLNINARTGARWGPSADGFSAADAEEFQGSAIDVFHIATGIGGADENEAHARGLQFFAAHNSRIANRPDVFARIDTAEELLQARTSGKIGVLLGLQDSIHFRTPSDVVMFHHLGQRVSQLTYNTRTRIGTGSTDDVDEGISEFGASIVEQMNTVGMAVDVSHCGDRTTLDAFEISEKPVLITHSNCRALCPNVRCKDDQAIEAMAATGGVMGITGVRMFVRDSEPTTTEHVVDHFDHVRDLVGVEHLGIGSDMDLHGYDDLPPQQLAMLKAGYKKSYAFRDKIDIEGIDHPKRMFDLTEALVRRGYSDDAIRGILGLNFARALKEIWAG